VSGLVLSGVTVAVPGPDGPRALVEGLSLHVRRGTVTCVVGPNGAGKTTLLKVAAGLRPPAAGTVTVDGTALAALAPRHRARRVGVLPQRLPLSDDMTVRAFVELGRHPHRSRWTGADPAGAAAVDRALAEAGITALAGARIFSVSGGEFQLARLAQLWATKTPYWILDEPTTALDPAHALRIAGLLVRAARTGHGLLVAIHDLEIARRIADRVACIGGPDAPAFVEGPAGAVVAPAVLDRVYGVRTRLWPDAVGFELPGDGPPPTVTA